VEAAKLFTSQSFESAWITVMHHELSFVQAVAAHEAYAA
jgi:hypothetical protein